MPGRLGTSLVGLMCICSQRKADVHCVVQHKQLFPRIFHDSITEVPHKEGYV